MECLRDPLPAYAATAPTSGAAPQASPAGHRPTCWAVLVVLVVLVVRRSSHEAHAALAPGGVTYWNPGSSAS